MLQTVEEFVEVHGSFSKEAFCARYAHPFLLLTGDSLLEDPGIFQTGPITALIDEGDHAAKRRNQQKYCLDCGEQLIKGA